MSHDAVSEILLDTESFSNLGAFTESAIPDELKPRLPEGWPWWGAPALLNNDPPQHTPIRRLAQKTLGPKYVNAVEPQIRQLAGEVLDRLDGAAECDLLSDFAKPFSIAVLALMLGADDEAANRFAQWSDDAFSVTNPALPADEVLERGRRIADFRDYLYEAIESRRTDPQDDVLTALVEARDEEDDAVLTTPEIMASAAQMIIGGSESDGIVDRNDCLSRAQSLSGYLAGDVRQPRHHSARSRRDAADQVADSWYSAHYHSRGRARRRSHPRGCEVGRVGSGSKPRRHTVSRAGEVRP